LAVRLDWNWFPCKGAPNGAINPKIHGPATAIAFPNDFDAIQLFLEFPAPCKIRREKELNQSSFGWSEFT
jgi:hypothetical protein